MYIDELEETREQRGIRENRNSIITIHIILATFIAMVVVAIGTTLVKHDHDLKECETRLYKHLTQKGD